jgi:hypothetical protein
MMSSGVNRVVDRVLAVQLRESETDGPLGVALLVPAERYAATILDGADEVRERKLTPVVWQEIDSWVIEGDAGLPAEPAPLSPAVAAALLESERPSTRAHRLVSFSMKTQGEEALAPTVRRLLLWLRDV